MSYGEDTISTCSLSLTFAQMQAVYATSPYPSFYRFLVSCTSGLAAYINTTLDWYFGSFGNASAFITRKPRKLRLCCVRQISSGRVATGSKSQATLGRPLEGCALFAFIAFESDFILCRPWMYHLARVWASRIQVI